MCSCKYGHGLNPATIDHGPQNMLTFAIMKDTFQWRMRWNSANGRFNFGDAASWFRMNWKLVNWLRASTKEIKKAFFFALKIHGNLIFISSDFCLTKLIQMEIIRIFADSFLFWNFKYFVNILQILFILNR
jgi:hypothetical protein